MRHAVRGWLLLVALVAGLAPAGAAPPAAPDADARYATGPRSPDGIGKYHLGREISAVMGWQGAAWLERPAREQEERTDLLVDALGLAPGDVVADIGAGTGYLALRMAAQVAPDGRVHAVDVQPRMVELLRQRVAGAGLANVEPRLGTVDDVGLPAGSVDVAVMVDVYHELEYPFEVLASIIRALKPGGRVVFVEYRAEDPRVPIKPLHRMSEAQIRREAALHPLAWERTLDVLPWQHIVVFRQREPRP